MPKLNFPAKNLFDKIKAHGYDIAQQSKDFFSASADTEAADKQADEKTSPDSSPQRATLSTLQRVTALPRAHSFSPWIGADFFLCISVKEAIDLSPSVPMPVATCDSFVRVTLGRPGALPLEEAETRVIVRNCYPMWEECLPFPLDHVTEETMIMMRILDKDIGHFNSFLGTVSIPLKDALAAIRKVDHEKIYRQPLLDRQNHARKRGELVFGVAIVAKQEYKEMRGFISSIQDPDTVHDSLRDHCLHLKLHCLKELSGISTSMLASLTVEVSVCSYVVRKPLSGQLVGGELDPEGAEVVVPLGPAFQDGDTLKGKNRAQFGEVKVELLAGRTRLAKTQVPIWDVPVRQDGGHTTPAPADSPAESDSEGESEREGRDRRRNLMSAFTGLSDATTTATTTTTSGNAPAMPRRAPAKSAAAVGLRTSSPDPDPRGVAGGMARAAELTATAAAAAAGVMAHRFSDSGGARESPPRGLTGKDSGATAGAGGSGSTLGGAGGRAPWDGKRYSRRMERLDRCLNRSPVAVLSMQLVKAEPGEKYEGGPLVSGSNVSLAASSLVPGMADMFSGADVDAPPEALAVPDFTGGQTVADYVVGVGPLALMKMIYADGAELMTRVWSAEKVTDMKVDPWGADLEGKALGLRNLAYMKPSPVGMVSVTSMQKVLLRHAGGFVVHQYVTPAVPTVGPCVRVFAQIVGQHVGPNKTRFTAQIKLEWFKTGMMVNMVKAKVEAATPGDTRKFFETLRQQLAAKHTVEDPAAAGGGGAAAATADGGSAAVATAAGVAAASGGGSGLLHHLSSSSVGIALAVMVGALLLALLLVVSAVSRVRGELGRSVRAVEGVTAELQAVARALESLTQRLPAAGGTGPPAVEL